LAKVRKIYEHVVATPIGWLGIRTGGAALTVLDILEAKPPVTGRPGPVALRVGEALGCYFAGDPAALQGLAVAPAGTAFQQRVWARLVHIPAGTTISYGDLARELGTAARAVGGACRANPIPLVVPCHRVVAAHGLGGYSGERAGGWLEKKRWLLAHEGIRP
jgi:methylated-DNA-[protein]-cysteine S-methyltransferase